MADVDSNCESMKKFRLVEVGEALEAIRNYVLQRTDDLHSEMISRIDERSAVDEIASNIAAVDPKSGKVLTLAQFEECVRLQRQLVDTLKEIPVSSEIQEEFLSMLIDSKKFFVSDEFYEVASHPHASRLEDIISKASTILTCRLCRSTRMEYCLKLRGDFVRLKVDELFLEMNKAEITAVKALKEITCVVTEKFGSNLTIDQFEEYVALHRRLITHAKKMLGEEAKICRGFEGVLRDIKKMVVPGGQYHNFVRKELRKEHQSMKEEPNCPEVYVIGSYIFLVLTFIASMFVY